MGGGAASPRKAHSPAPMSAPQPLTSDRWPNRDAVKGDPRLSPWIYRAIVRWSSFMVRGYHRTEIRGEQIPIEGPILLVQNHSNGLCDAHFPLASTPRPIRLLVKYKLMKMPFIGWILRTTRAVPMYRMKDGVDTRQNASSFEAIDEALHERTIIALFPEGESLDAIGLRSLRSGVGRMAVSGVETYEGELGLMVVPIGVTYEDRDRYRCLASVIIGAPIDVAEIINKIPEEETRPRITAVMRVIRASMRELIPNAESPDEYNAMVALERLLPRDDAPLGMRRRRALEVLRADTSADAEARATSIVKLTAPLTTARLSGDDIMGEAPGLGATFGPLLYLAPLFLMGILTWGLPMPFGWMVSRRRKSPDKLVTVRMMFSFAGLLVWAPVMLLLGALAQGWVGALTAAAIAVASILTFPAVTDGLHRVRARMLHRSIAANEEGLTSYRDSITSIRRVYGGA